MAHDPDASPLVQRIVNHDASVRMPPEGQPLNSQQIDTIRQWIMAGAVSPENDAPEPSPDAHWAFQPLTPLTLPPSPALTNESIPVNPIDSWINLRLQQAGLTANPLASKELRLRRLYLDLIGIPPTPQQLADFLHNPSPHAYEDQVHALLASPLYGERWGRHWMDVWRYADWFGRRHVPDVWNSAPQIWRWRDWIVDSLNADKGYDQMIREMLAADEVLPTDPQASVATGYLIRNWYALNPNDWMRSNVEHSAKAFLGLTFHCAHCHDHKYDPISQQDYFKFRAFFEPIGVRQDRVPGQPDPGPFQPYEYSSLRKVQRLGLVRIFDQNPELPTWFYTGGDERNRLDKLGSIPPGVPSFLSSFFQPPSQVMTLPPRAWYPGLHPALQNSLLSDATQQLAAAQAHYDTLLASPARTTEAPEADLTELRAAEIAFENAQASANRITAVAPLAGSQSLLFDANQGRRMIYHPLDHITNLQTGNRLSFTIRLLSDEHFNFQLTRDNSQGLTATYVGFEQGTIKSYQPGTFQDFTVATFDRHSDTIPQDTFDCTIIFDLEADRALLNVVAHANLPDVSPNKIADNVPIALNGWNPAGDPTKGILFDARPGAWVAVDSIELSSNDGQQVLFTCDFEPPTYSSAQDIVGIAGWSNTSFSTAPASSLAVTSLPNPRLRDLEQKLASAQRRVARPSLPLSAARTRVEACQAQLASLQARIAADVARFEPRDAVHADQANSLAQAAIFAEQHATLTLAQSQAKDAEYQLAEAEALPLDDAQRADKIAAATQQLSVATTTLAQAPGPTSVSTDISYSPLTPLHPKTSTGRRTALANWITHQNNPLTARVAVNHIWLRHFHAPLVASVYDFGRNGAKPSHPELLDWLATELIRSGWSMKHLHYLIVTSQAYQRSSSLAVARQSAIDPDNKLLWRMNTGRLEAEAIRDSILALADQLDSQFGGQELENKDSFTTFRRSLYYSCQPEEDGKSEFSILFDAPDPNDCYRRTRTIIPQQSLALTNSPLIHELSPTIATQIASHSHSAQPEPTEFITLAFEAILCRSPSVEEFSACQAFLKANPDPTQLYSSLVRVLLNHNDFITIR
jgi:hypothetical protein